MELGDSMVGDLLFILFLILFGSGVFIGFLMLIHLAIMLIKDIKDDFLDLFD